VLVQFLVGLRRLDILRRVNASLRTSRAEPRRLQPFGAHEHDALLAARVAAARLARSLRSARTASRFASNCALLIGGGVSAHLRRSASLPHSAASIASLVVVELGGGGIGAARLSPSVVDAVEGRRLAVTHLHRGV
jgi:hypothetical protein